MRRESLPAGGSVWWWDSPAELARAADAELTHKTCDPRWTGRTWDEAVRGAVSGDASLVAEAERLLASIEARVDAPRTEWSSAMAGAFPVVADAIAGRPDCMRRRVASYDDRAPVRIFVEIGAAAGVGHDVVRRRGVAILALVMLLSRERAVELWVLGGWGSSESRDFAAVCAMRVQVSDLAVACDALTSGALDRAIIRWWLHEKARADATSWPWQTTARAALDVKYRAALGAAPTDILVPPTELTDELVRDPVAWVKRSLAEHGAREVEP